MPRYQLLLNELIKRTKKINRWHSDLNDLSIALKQISNVNQIINERMKEWEQKEKVKQIKMEFDSASLTTEIIIPSRYFIMDNHMDSTNKCFIQKHNKYGNEFNIYLVLFNDSLVYGYFRWRSKVIFENLLPFDDVFEIEDVAEKYKGMHCIKILSSTESIWISFQTKEHKTKWIEKISEALQIESNKNIRKSDAKALVQKVCLVPNDFSETCMECDDVFSITNRRHHCYSIKCGILICGNCSEFKICAPNSEGISEQIRCCRSCFVKERQTVQTICSRMKNILKNNLHIVMVMVIFAIFFRDYLFDLSFNLISSLLT